MNRAYSTFEIKSVNPELRTFEGIATTPSTDRMDDIVEPTGARFKLPVPILMQHGKGANKDPVGWVRAAKVTSAGIAVTVEIAKVDGPPSLKEDLDRAWALVDTTLLRGLSIGFAPLDSEPIKGSFGTRFTKWDWLELSLVSVPANQDATILSIKSVDSSLRSAADELPKSTAVQLRPISKFIPGEFKSAIPSDKRKKDVAYL